MLMTLDKGNVAALALLDLSAAFNTVDHRILLCHPDGLHVDRMDLSWITSYLTDRQATSTSQYSSIGVTQGSVL